MDEKRPIDKRRDSAFSMLVGDETDQSAIREMISVGDDLYIVKDEGLWLVQHADKIDPERTNPALPNSSKKILSRGATDSLVCRSLLQSRVLMREQFLPAGFDVAAGIANAFAFLVELDALQRIADDYRRLVDSKNEAYATSAQQRGAVTLPSIEDVAVRTRSYILGADRATLALHALGQLFYPDLALKKGWFERLKARMADADASVGPYISGLEGGVKFLRNTRNSVEHGKPGQRVIVTNYELKADGTLYVPSIEVEHDETPLEPTDLRKFFDQMIAFLIGSHEGLLVSLASIHVQSFSGIPASVIELPEDRRRYRGVRYAFAAQLGDQLVPYLN